MTREKAFENYRQHQKKSGPSRKEIACLAAGGLLSFIGIALLFYSVLTKFSGGHPAPILPWIYVSTFVVGISSVVFVLVRGMSRIGPHLDKRNDVVRSSGEDDTFYLRWPREKGVHYIPAEFVEHTSSGDVRVVVDLHPGLLTTEMLRSE